MVYVNSLATVAKNIVVKIDGVAIGEIADEGIPLPIATTEDIEVTNQDSGDFKEYKQGRRDGGEIEIIGNYVSGDAGQIALAAAADAGSINVYRVELPNGAVWTFSGVSKTFSTPVKNKMIMYDAKVKVTGKPILSVSSKAALTTPFFAVALAASGGGTGAITISPAASATEGSYIVNCATGVLKVKVTPTCASTGAVMYVDSTLITAEVTGVEYELAVSTPKEVLIKVSEPAKATAFYRLFITRAAS